MFKSQLFTINGRAALIAVALAAALSGCATLQADQKCESAGCGSDAQISAAVEQSFARHPELGAPGDLRVETLNHVVYLNGIVYTDWDGRSAMSGICAQFVRRVLTFGVASVVMTGCGGIGQ